MQRGHKSKSPQGNNNKLMLDVHGSSEDMMHKADSATSFLGRVPDPSTLYKENLAKQKKKYQVLLDQISYLDTDCKMEDKKYKYNEMMPYIFFFKFLAKRPDLSHPNYDNTFGRLKLWIPDTILTPERDVGAMWLYSSSEGYVYRVDNFNGKSILNKLGNNASPDELVGILKKAQYRQSDYVGNDVKLITTKDLALISNSLSTHKGELLCLQRYIKSIGPKAFIVRTCWRKERNPYVWIITNKNDYFSKDRKVPENQRFITNVHAMGSCSIVHSIRGRYVEETLPYIKNIIKFVERNIQGAHFEEFVADFVKDEAGTWWMINIKAFQLVDEIPLHIKSFFTSGSSDEEEEVKENHERKFEGMKVVQCKYCEEFYPTDQMNHKMTLKMLMQTDKHLMHRGETFEWLNRSDIKHIDTTLLFQEHKVCKCCYKLYQATEKLRAVEFQFARVLGIPVSLETRSDQVSITSFNIPDYVEHEKKSVPLEADEEADPKASLMLLNNEALLSDNKKRAAFIPRYRMMVYIRMLYDIPKDLEGTKHYYIDYSIFDIRQKYKIELNQAMVVNGSILIPLNRLRVFYFFSPDRKGVNDFLMDQKTIVFNLWCEQEKIASIDFDLKDFLNESISKREMYKMFQGKKLPLLSWGMKLSLGLMESGTENINRVKMTEYKRVFLTSPDYFNCDPLPEEWLQVFLESQNNLNTLLGKSELGKSDIKNSRINQSLLSCFSPDPNRSSLSKSHSQQFNLRLSATATDVKKSGSMLKDMSASNNNNQTPLGNTVTFVEDKINGGYPDHPQEVDENEELNSTETLLRGILFDEIDKYEKPVLRPKSSVKRGFSAAQSTNSIKKRPEPYPKTFLASPRN
jgi:LMBR1 domain-containing protein 1